MNSYKVAALFFAGGALVLITLCVSVAWLEDRRQERVVRIAELAARAETQELRELLAGRVVEEMK